MRPLAPSTARGRILASGATSPECQQTSCCESRFRRRLKPNKRPTCAVGLIPDCCPNSSNEVRRPNGLLRRRRIRIPLLPPAKHAPLEYGSHMPPNSCNDGHHAPDTCRRRQLPRREDYKDSQLTFAAGAHSRNSTNHAPNALASDIEHDTTTMPCYPADLSEIAWCSKFGLKQYKCVWATTPWSEPETHGARRTRYTTFRYMSGPPCVNARICP